MHSKGSHKKMKRQPSEWERVTLNEAIAKRLIFKIYKQLMKLNIRKTNKPIKNRAEDLNIPFSKEDIQMTSKHMKNAQHQLLLEKCNQNYNEVSLPHQS